MVADFEGWMMKFCASLEVFRKTLTLLVAIKLLKIAYFPRT
jgi:hypothetical protein